MKLINTISLITILVMTQLCASEKYPIWDYEKDSLGVGLVVNDSKKMNKSEKSEDKNKKNINKQSIEKK